MVQARPPACHIQVRVLRRFRQQRRIDFLRSGGIVEPNQQIRLQKAEPSFAGCRQIANNGPCRREVVLTDIGVGHRFLHIRRDILTMPDFRFIPGRCFRIPSRPMQQHAPVEEQRRGVGISFLQRNQLRQRLMHFPGPRHRHGPGMWFPPIRRQRNIAGQTHRQQEDRRHTGVFASAASIYRVPDLPAQGRLTCLHGRCLSPEHYSCGGKSPGTPASPAPEPTKSTREFSGRFDFLPTIPSINHVPQVFQY